MSNILSDENIFNMYTSICENYRNVMVNEAKKILKARLSQYAEDAVQNAFLSIATNMSLIVDIPDDKLKFYLIRIVKNKAIDIYRKENRYEKMPIEDYVDYFQSSFLSPLENVIISESYKNVVNHIQCLNEIYKKAIIYRVFYSLSDKEIATMLGITPKTANVRIFRAKKKLQELIGGNT